MMKIPLTGKPCPLCLELAQGHRLRVEAVQRVPEGAHAPLDFDGDHCCHDCASAYTLMKVLPDMMTFEMARVAVGNDRQEQYRLPGIPMGTVGMSITRPSAPGDLEDQHKWLDKHGWFGQGEL